MLSFASEFPVKQGDPQAFVTAVRSWLEGSPHTTLNAKTLANLPLEGRWKTETDRERLEAMLASRDGEATAAFRHTVFDGDIEWTTLVAFSSSPEYAWVGVRTARESSQPQLGLPPAKKPLIVRMLLDVLGGGLDGEVYVSDKPLRLQQNDLGMTARLLNADSDNYLPVVYVSCGFDGELAIDPDPLARSLGGMAHVLVEPDREFSRSLQSDVGSINVYGGRVGLYWPNGTRYSYYINGDNPTEFDVRQKLVSRLRRALLNRRPLTKCTWAKAEAEVARKAFQQLKDSGSHNVDEYVKFFDAEIAAKNSQLEDAENEIRYLKSQLRVNNGRNAFSDLGFNFGDEQELYSGEFLGVIGDVLNEAINRVKDGSRRQHIISAIASNTEFGAGPRDRRDKIKEILRNYSSMNKAIRADLESMGFSIGEDGKHYKLIYMNDGRYTFSLPKTGSDHRGGLNAASDIGSRVF